MTDSAPERSPRRVIVWDHPIGPVVFKNRDLVNEVIPGAADWLEKGGFGSEWRDRALWEHEVARAMSLRWGLCAEFLADVGDLLRCVHASTEPPHAVVSDLQSVAEFDARLLEARAARILVEAKLQFHFVPETKVTTSHDIRVSHATDPFNIEVKGITEAKLTAVARELSSIATSGLGFADLGVALEFTWNGSDVAALDLSDPLDWSEVARLGHQARPILEEAVAEWARDNVTRTVRLNALGSVRLRALASDEDRALWISYTMESPRPHRLGRLLRRAATQLPTELPGVVVLATNPNLYDEETSRDAVEHWFRSGGSSERAHVAAVVVMLTAHLAGGVIERPFVVANPAATFAVPTFLSDLKSRRVAAEDVQ